MSTYRTEGTQAVAGPAPLDANRGTAYRKFPLSIISGVLGFAALAALLVGVGATVLESNNHTVCDSGLGQLAQALSQDAATQCATANFVFYGGMAVAFLGAITFLAALIIAGIGATRRS